MTPLPFSGLSLIVHLGIIIGAWLFRVGGFRGKKGILKFSESWIFPKRVLSLFVLVSVCTLMTMFIIVAITTGAREGATEWHRMQISGGIGQLKEMGDTLYPEFMQYSLRYDSRHALIAR